LWVIFLFYFSIRLIYYHGRAQLRIETFFISFSSEFTPSTTSYDFFFFVGFYTQQRQLLLDECYGPKVGIDIIQKLKKQQYTTYKSLWT